MIKCVVVDDELPAIDVLATYINQLPGIELAGTATNPLEGIEIIKQTHPDVAFLDVQMQEMNGLELMQLLDKETLVVFCTAYSEFAIRSYDLRAVDYLMKPIRLPRFMQAIERVADMMSAKSTIVPEAIPDDYLFVKTEHKGKMIKIDMQDIDFVEALRNYVAFYRGKQKTLAYISMKELENRLPKSQFIRVHKSFIVAIKQVSSMEYSELILKNTSRHIPIGNNYKALFMDLLKDKLLFWGTVASIMCEGTG